MGHWGLGDEGGARGPALESSCLQPAPNPRARLRFPQETPVRCGGGGGPGSDPRRGVGHGGDQRPGPADRAAAALRAHQRERGQGPVRQGEVSPEFRPGANPADFGPDSGRELPQRRAPWLAEPATLLRKDSWIETLKSNI